MIDNDFLIEKLLENIPCYFYYVLWVHMWSVFKTANDEQEDISSFLSHLDSIDVASPNIEKTSYIFKNLNEDESEFIQGQLNTWSVVNDSLSKRRTGVILSLLKLRLSGGTHFQNCIQVVDWGVNDVNLVPNYVIVNVLIELGWSVNQELNLFPHVA